MITINFKKVLLGMSLLGALTGTQAFAAKERGNGGTGIIFKNSKATIGDTYYKAEYEPFELEEEVKEELKKLYKLSEYFDLLLPTDFWNCEVFDDCDNNVKDIRLTNKLPIEKIIKIDKSQMTSTQIQELKYIMAYGYTTKDTTWLVKDFYEKLSTKDKALAYLHERMHTLNDNNVNHEYIMWYISGLSKLRDIDLRKTKYSLETFEYLKKYTFYAYKKITSFEFAADRFQHFKYSQKGEALTFYKNKEDTQRIEINFNFENSLESLKYFDLSDFTVIDENSNVTIVLTHQINSKYMQPCLGNCIFTIKGKNNKIIYNDPHFQLRDSERIDGDNNIIAFSSDISIYGNNNVVINSKHKTIYGDNNVLSFQHDSMDDKYITHSIYLDSVFNTTIAPAYISGNNNVITDTKFYKIEGSNNFLAGLDLDRIKKDNQTKTKGDYFWHTNNQKKEKNFIETLNNKYSHLFKIRE